MCMPASCREILFRVWRPAKVFFLFLGGFMLSESKPISEWLSELASLERGRAQDQKPTLNGGLAIVGGQLLMKKPENGGRWPTITSAPGSPVKILYHGRQIERPLVLEDSSAIEFEVTQKPAQSSFKIVVSKDKMEVWLVTEFVPGIEYQVCDSNYTTNLSVTAKEVRQHPPEPIDPALVFQQLESLGIKIELHSDQILSACYGLKSGKWMIGVGIPPKPPVDGRVDLVCDLTSRQIQKEPEGRVDLLDRGKISSVEPGEVLAYWHPPVEGEPGLDVFGATIEPRPPKRMRLSAGPGVKLMENGTVAVAEIAGRPCWDQGRLCVRPELIISSDVDVSTGNIEFIGDVIVTGDVKESLTIKAGGMVEVKGNVYNARIVAGSDVVIHKNLICGHVSAGGDIGNYMKAIALIKQIVPGLKNVQKAFQQLKEHPRFSVEDLKIRGDGYLIKLILEMRFADIPKLFGKLQEVIPELKDLEQDSDINKIWLILHHTCNCFQGANPLSIKSISEVDTYLNCLSEICTWMEDVVSTPADIRVNYCQNAQLEATGNIIITGPLVYGCNMVAGANIEIVGSCRGGSYYATSCIKVKSAGLNERVKTALTVGSEGVIVAGTLNPGVNVGIGQGKMVIRDTRRNVQLKFEDGRWMDKTGNGGY